VIFAPQFYTQGVQGWGEIAPEEIGRTAGNGCNYRIEGSIDFDIIVGTVMRKTHPDNGSGKRGFDDDARPAVAGLRRFTGIESAVVVYYAVIGGDEYRVAGADDRYLSEKGNTPEEEHGDRADSLNSGGFVNWFHPFTFACFGGVAWY
jgi:hypothetical protein